MKCKSCGAELEYIEDVTSSVIISNKKIYHVDKNGNLSLEETTTSSQPEINETFEVVCPKCGKNYDFKIKNKGISISTIVERRLYNSIFNQVMNDYGNYSDETLKKFCYKLNIVLEEMNDFMKYKSEGLSSDTLNKIIKHLEPSEDIKSFWFNHYLK